MAKVTSEYVEQRFYERFARMPKPEQRGILAALRAVMLATPVQPGAPEENGELFAEEPSDTSNPV